MRARQARGARCACVRLQASERDTKLLNCCSFPVNMWLPLTFKSPVLPKLFCSDDPHRRCLPFRVGYHPSPARSVGRRAPANRCRSLKRRLSLPRTAAQPTRTAARPPPGRPLQQPGRRGGGARGREAGGARWPRRYTGWRGAGRWRRGPRRLPATQLRLPGALPRALARPLARSLSRRRSITSHKGLEPAERRLHLHVLLR